jgi:hypothetical protein
MRLNIDRFTFTDGGNVSPAGVRLNPTWHLTRRGASRLQSLRPVRRVAELGSFIRACPDRVSSRRMVLTSNENGCALIEPSLNEVEAMAQSGHMGMNEQSVVLFWGRGRRKPGNRDQDRKEGDKAGC